MLFGFNQADVFAIIVFGLFTNFAFTLYFSFLIEKNVSFHTIIAMLKERKQKPWYIVVLIIIPFGKALLTLWRVYVLQIYFLNRGKTYTDFFKYINR
jgi:hypothetical protein